ncbi:MAG: hypothetical protein M3138_07215, partial [Actinomycetota bacterium]|nr:hypothetical protein [Actinomycetota bacterium]
MSPFERLRGGWSPAAALLLGLLVIDSAFVLLHVSYDPQSGGFFGDRRVLVSEDVGYAEIFGYLKVIGAAVLLLILYRRRAAPVYLAWTVVLLAITADDALSLHEKAGAQIDSFLGRSQETGLLADIGEPILWAVAGLGLLAGTWLAHRRSEPQAQADSRWLFLLL